MKKVAIYARVSTLEQAEHGYSIGEQVDKLKKYCDIHDYSIYKEYVDGGYSGAKLDRPAMKELIDDANNGKFEAVIVYKLDRLSRNLQNALYLIKDVFKANNISFASLSENIDLSTAAGELNFNMFASFAEFERANIRDRMSMGAYARAKSGKCAGPSRTPFGYNYDDGILRKNEYSHIIESIFKMYLSGMSLAKILIKLNDDGYIGKQKHWRLSAIYTVIRNKTYAGFIKYHDEYFKGLHEPIVSSDEFDEVQRQIAIRQDKSYSTTNSSRPFQSKYMLSGLLRCGKCGQRLTLIQYRKKGSEYRSKKYQCVGKQSHYKRLTGGGGHGEKCDTPNYDMKELEEFVIKEIDKIKIDFDGYIARKDFAIKKTDLSTAKKEIENIETKLSKLVDLYLENKIDLNLYTSRKDEYDTKLSALKKAVIEPEKDDKLLEVDELKDAILEFNAKDMNYEQQSEMLKRMIEKIVINQNDIKIYLNIG